MTTKKNSPQNNPTGVSASTSEFPKCGYQIYEIERAQDKWKCTFCQRIMKEPVQMTECGHRACKGCFECRAAVATDGKMSCPLEDDNNEFDKTEVMNDRAFKKELDMFSVICMYKDDEKCPWSGLLKTYQEHLDEKHVRFTCSMCQKSFPTSQSLVDHQEKECNRRFQKCPLAPYCGEGMIQIEEFAAHLLSEKHQEALALAVVGKYSIPETTDQDHGMDTTPANDELEEETSTKLTELADKVQKLNDETVDLSRESVKLDELCQVASQEVTSFQIANNERNIVMSKLQPKQDDIQKEIEKLKDLLEENQYVSTDGTLTWRVDRVAERMADAQSERQPSIYSPIFYSSPTGYKMRARLYLHGDGNARRTHMSLFFLLMRGEYDPLLPWPFGHKVTFCLFDQTGNNRHIIDSFRPDVKSSSFQQPKTDSNIASGIPKFFPLPMIQQDDNAYVRDDTLFLKIIVDLNDTPKMVLPYMLTLNPGLPNHVQQTLIHQERLKKQQQINATESAQATPTNTCG